MYNFVLTRFLGICPFLGVSKKISTALGMGGAVIFVMTLASFCTSLIYHYVLQIKEIAGFKVNLGFLQILLFIVVIAGLVQLLEIILQKVSPVLYGALGIYLPLITTNCAVLGVALTNVQKSYNFIESVVNGIGISVGFTIAIVLMAGIREKIEYNDVPHVFKGSPIVLITAGLMSIAFFGFSGLI